LVQVAVHRRRRPDADGAVGHLDPGALAVGGRVDGDRLDAELVAGADHAHGDLAPGRDQHPAGHQAGGRSDRGLPDPAGSAFLTRIRRTVPACSAFSSLNSFMASSTQSTWPTSTRSPSSTNAGWAGEGAR